MLSSTSKRWTLALGVAALSAGGSAPGSRVSPPVEVRPSVALLLTIDATDYLDKINDATCSRDCRRVRDALADSTLAIVRGTYPFLNWDDPQHATDTVIVRLTSKGAGEIPWILLDLRVSPPSGRPESTLVDFENYRAFRDRDERDDWSADSLRRQWAKRMREMLRNENLVESVFGRIPINAPAKINGRRWYVNVPGRRIRQVSYETPTFQIRTVFRDPVDGVDTVWIRLAPCNMTSDWQGYNCGISRILFSSKTVAAGASLDSVLQRASFDDVARVHLVTFKADTAQGGLGGATWH
jgi:hypothetical protein